MLPLKTLSYGVAMHTFCDYFQMSCNLAIEACRQFDSAITFLYQDEWMRCPTKDDMTAIVNLHTHQHNVSGMLGSLDCSQTFWKNCPKAWHGTYKTGKEKKPSIVLEAICDYHCFFWHTTYGYAGSLSDENVMSCTFHHFCKKWRTVVLATSRIILFLSRLLASSLTKHSSSLMVYTLCSLAL